MGGVVQESGCIVTTPTLVTPTLTLLCQGLTGRGAGAAERSRRHTASPLGGGWQQHRSSGILRSFAAATGSQTRRRRSRAENAPRLQR
jgi:hypothetical protein